MKKIPGLLHLQIRPVQIDDLIMRPSHPRPAVTIMSLRTFWPSKQRKRKKDVALNLQFAL